jgi:uncharacterized membrane protein
VVSEQVVLADCLATLPAILVQLLTGVALIRLCWIPVVWLQIRMRDLARESEHAGAASPGQVYRVYARVWFWLGVPAFAAVMLVFWLMVTKPQ